MIPTCRRATLLLLTFLLALSVVPAAFAHTEVASTSPEDGATVDEPLDEVTMTFAEALQEDGDHALGVFAPDGETRVDLDDLTAPSPDQLAVGVGELTETGTYEVRWVIIAADGDEQRGTFTFDVTETALGAPASDPTTSEPDPTATTDVPAATEDATTSTRPEDTTTTEAAPTETSTTVTPEDVGSDVDVDTAGQGDADEGGGLPILVVLLAVVVVAAVVLLAVRSRGSSRT